MSYRVFTDAEVFQAKTDPHLQEVIIQNFRKVAHKYAYYYVNHSWNPNWELDDYYAVGLYGIYYAIQYYNPEGYTKGPARSFCSLVFLSVRGQCSALRQTFYLGRTSLTKQERYECVKNQISLDTRPPESKEYQGDYKDLLLDETTDLEQSLLQEEESQDFWDSIKQVLTPQELELVRLHYLNDYSYKEIATKVQLSYHTTRRKILAALEKLQQSPHLQQFVAA